jgi:hypothetical protein
LLLSSFRRFEFACERDLHCRLLGFSDGHAPLLVTHRLSEMLAQWIYCLARGYEDPNDHEQLRNDPLLGCSAASASWAQPLAGNSTLNRLELTGRSGFEIGYSAEAMDRLLTDLFIFISRRSRTPKPPSVSNPLILDRIGENSVPSHQNLSNGFPHIILIEPSAVL